MIRYITTLLALLGVAHLANAQCYSYSYRSYYAPSYQSYNYSYSPAGWYAGRWYPAGNYYYSNGTYYLQGYGAFYGYENAPTAIEVAPPSPPVVNVVTLPSPPNVVINVPASNQPTNIPPSQSPSEMSNPTASQLVAIGHSIHELTGVMRSVASDVSTLKADTSSLKTSNAQLDARLKVLESAAVQPPSPPAPKKK